MKNKKKILMMMPVLLLSFIYTACDKEETEVAQQGFKIYYVNDECTQLKSSEYEVESESLEEQVDEVLEELGRDRDDGESVLPNGVYVESYSIYKNVIYLYFSKAYGYIENNEEIFTRAAVTLSLTQLEGIEGVSFYIEKKPLRDVNGQAVGVLEASNFIDNIGNTINNFENITITLYYANIWGNSLRMETRTGLYDSSSPLEKYIVEQIIKGPSFSNNYSVIPDGVEVNSVNTNNGVCYVDLSKEFVQGTSTVKDEIMIYSIVNSLTELSYINKVQITVEGESDVTLHNGMELNQLYSRTLSYLE